MYSDNPRGTVILLTGCLQAQEARLIPYLHTGLIDKGWNSILISLRDIPLAQQGRLIQASRKVALAKVNAPVILLADACHGNTVLDWASQQNNRTFTAYITLGLDQKEGQYVPYLNAPCLMHRGQQIAAI